jgi:hypothetical protein
MNERFRLQYTQSNDNGDTELDVDVTFETSSTYKVMANINTWLAATGYPLEVQIKAEEDLTGEED